MGFEPTTPGLKVRLPSLYITYAPPAQTDSVSGIGADDAGKAVAIGALAPTSGDKMATELSTKYDGKPRVKTGLGRRKWSLSHSHRLRVCAGQAAVAGGLTHRRSPAPSAEHLSRRNQRIGVDRASS